MPAFRWKGRTTGGQTVDGELDAPSKEEVIVRLRQRGITVSSITEFGSSSEPADPEARTVRNARSAPRPQRGRVLLFVLGVVAIAAAISWFAPLTTYRCDRRPDGRVDCTVTEHLLGLYPLRSQTLAGITSVRTSATSAGRSRIVFATRSGQSIEAAVWDESFPTGDVSDDLSSFVSTGTEAHITRWQIARTPLIAIAILLIFASTLIAALILSSFASVQASMAAWAEKTRRERRAR